ncbi:hypothetical protein CDAR_270061 [Caerostris darwini]|uniref:Uncharacterized protein n=1 Tax=Caerostris darwini TaxID=1538125 RepID=A0AAV4RR27_9ARAC|nr:hypothetical protein CDAR_270061 [Caerostris darwini]
MYTLRNILRDELACSFRMRKLHALDEDNYFCFLEFERRVKNAIRNDPQFHSKELFTDVATFTSVGDFSMALFMVKNRKWITLEMGSCQTVKH